LCHTLLEQASGRALLVRHRDRIASDWPFLDELGEAPSNPRSRLPRRCRWWLKRSANGSGWCCATCPAC
jgi:hypothetical protein